MVHVRWDMGRGRGRNDTAALQRHAFRQYEQTVQRLNDKSRHHSRIWGYDGIIHETAAADERDEYLATASLVLRRTGENATLFKAAMRVEGNTVEVATVSLSRSSCHVIVCMQMKSCLVPTFPPRSSTRNKNFYAAEASKPSPTNPSLSVE
nr:hypothetical protein CFP56_70114 [Quercus suber]